MPSTKTISAAEVIKSVSSKSTPKTKSAPIKQSAKFIRPTVSTLSTAQFPSSATTKSNKNRATETVKIAPKQPMKQPTKTSSSTRSSAQLSLLDSAVSNTQKRAPKVSGTKTVKEISAQKTVESKKVQPKNPSKPQAITEKTMVEKNSKSKTASTKSIVGEISPTKTTKAKRSRVPKDFAQTYGENVKERVEIVPVKERRARKTAQQREQRRALMAPDDDILQRLARVQTVSISRQSAPKRRSKKWESRCGKCGGVTAFETNAALCSHCGAIVVRD